MWTSRDERAEERLQAAIAEGDLCDALLAIDGAANAATVETLATLHTWAQTLRDVVADIRAPRAAWLALRHVLADEASLIGDGCDYYAVRNSALSEVVRRRKGQPILLAAVWIIVGRLAGLRIDGVGLPGHFIVRIGGENGLLADPFNAGRTLTDADCGAMVAQLSGGALPWEASYLAATSTGAISERVLRNLMNASQRAGDRRGMYRATRLLATVRSGDVAAVLLHARMAEELGAVCLARRLYEQIQRDFGGTCEALVAQRRLQRVLCAERELH